MTNTVTVEMPDGLSVELDVDLLKAYVEESFGYLKAEAEAKNQFKEAVEMQCETLGIDKKVYSKYIKAAFKQKTKETSVLGETFAALDEAMDEKLEIVRD